MTTPEPPLVRHFTLADDNFVEIADYESGDGVDMDPREEGRVLEVISGELSGSKDLHVGVARMQPGEYHIRHHHPLGSEFYFFLSGEAVVHVDGVDYPARRGTSVYLPPNTVHSVRNTGSETVDLVFGLDKPEYADIGIVYDE